MSADGQGRWTRGPGTMAVATRLMAPGTRYAWHRHEDHQILWAASGVLTVATAAANWVLPPTRALWIPAGLEHETGTSTPATTLRAVYFRPEACPVAWTRSTPITARPLLAELIGYLESEGLPAAARARAEDVLLDLLEPTPVHTIELRIPGAGPARPVALALTRDPADRRTLEAWGREVGASGRTRHAPSRPRRGCRSAAGVPWRGCARPCRCSPTASR